MINNFFRREDEGEIAFVSMMISVALTLGIAIAIALLGYLIVFTVLFWLMTVVGISEIVAFTIAYAFGMGWCYATLLGFAFEASDIYLSIYMTLSQSWIPAIVDTYNSWTSWIGDMAQSAVAQQRANLGL